MINFSSNRKNILEIKRLGKYILPVCFIMLAILYAGTKPVGRNAARANAKDAKSAEERIEEIVNSGQLSVDCGQRLDGMLVLVESRLIELDNLDVDEGEPCIIMMSYDYKGRRISKQVYVMGEWDNYPLARVHSYVYDDWNLILETITNADNTTQEIQYFWGNDLSGTLNGAGGVGGLIAVSIDGYYYIPSYDNNGNILSYVNEQGQVVASYKYDAFGNTLEQTGSMSTAFNHRFSTKYCDDEMGHYYYGYRFYSPQLGRWLNRDPIEEDGGLNLYGFCENNAVAHIDYNGYLALVLDVMGTRSSRLYQNATLDEFDSSINIINHILEDLSNVSNEMFNKAKDLGNVKFNKKVFKGSLSEYRQLIEREKDSLYIYSTGAGYQNSLLKLESLVSMATKDWDVVAITVHGESLDKIPTNKMVFNDERIDTPTALRALRNIGLKGDGKFYIVSCYRTWVRGINPESTIEGFQIKHARGRVVTRKNSDTSSGCRKILVKAEFETIGVNRKINGKYYEPE